MILELKEAYVFLPSVAEMRETVDAIEEKCKLPNFAAGIDGIHIRFAQASTVHT